MPTAQPFPAAPSSSKRIALCIHAMQGGGAERVMSQLANYWSVRHEVHLITWSDQLQDAYPLNKRLHRHGLNLQAPSSGLGQGIFANLKRVRALRHTLKTIDPQLVVSFCDQMNIVTLEALRAMTTVPVWIAEHSDPEQQRLSPLWERWRRRNYHHCTGCVALTESIAKFMTRWIPAQRLRVIPNALGQLPNSINYQAQAPAGLNTILFVGRLSQEKGLDLLLAAWRIAHELLPQWQLKMVGDGPARAGLQAAAGNLPRIEFSGWSSNPEQFYSSSQLFVLSSRYEGFPMALIEALSYGLPAVTTNCSSALEQLKSVSGQACLQVMQGDSPAELANHIIRLAQDQATRQRMSESARQVAQQYSWPAIAPKWDQLLIDSSQC
jgi:GalNAc-alpha-(1->4)-GalNAc-alpha-(1->3)-diNAcBac-PP-undecaprenol alpha-1,4-N-acetyl-D-galactosaminyltransferase